MGSHHSKKLSRYDEFKKKSIFHRSKQDQQPQHHEETHQQYRQCYQAYHSNSNFLNELLIQNPRFAANLQKTFPNASANYQQFLSMILFLTKNQIREETSDFVKKNASHTNLLQRFFMIVLQIPKYEDLETMTLNDDQLEDAFIQFMKLFIPNPSKGFIQKLKKWISLQKNQTVTIRQISSALKDSLPLINDSLNNYMKRKFRDLQKNGFLLQKFNSAILKEDAVFLCLILPELEEKEIKLLYSTETDGLSFHSYETRLIGYDGPFLLLIESEDEKVTYKLGSYQVGPVRDLNEHQGDLRGFMFTIQPNIRFMTTDNGDQASNYYFINTMDEKLGNMKRGIGFGGDKNKNECKLWIDQNLDKSTVFNGFDPTYGFGTLANPMSTKLSIQRMQIWGLGNNQDLQNQALYWEERGQEALRRRKIDKKQLLNGLQGTMLQKTFAHRDQVIGEIQKKEEQK